MSDNKKGQISPITEGACPHCGANLNFSEKDRSKGEKILCPKCSKKFEINEAKVIKKKKRKGCLMVVIILIVLSIIGMFAMGSAYEEKEDDLEQEESVQEEVEVEDEPEQRDQEEVEIEEPAVVSFGNGTHIVGTDIEPGTYRSEGTGLCYWARLQGFSGELDDIIANGNNPMEIVIISDSDTAFETSGCGKWVAIESTYPESPETSFSDGTYEVGKHIEPGTYRADGDPDDLCYWARLSNFSHSGVSGIIANGNSPTVIQIAESDKGFKVSGCGSWAKIE
jgi:DNA-directed RNA polymerase subunit RPC12/RpoP